VLRALQQQSLDVGADARVVGLPGDALEAVQEQAEVHKETDQVGITATTQRHGSEGDCCHLPFEHSPKSSALGDEFVRVDSNADPLEMRQAGDGDNCSLGKCEIT